MTIIIHRSQAPGFVAVVCIFVDALIPVFAPPEHLGWLRWRIPLIVFAAIAIAALVAQLLILSRQEHEREQKEEKRDKQFEELLASIRLQKTPASYSLESGVGETTTPKFSPREKLEKSKEEVWVEDSLKMSEADLKINIAHDPEFRKNFYALPDGRYPDFDKMRAAIAEEPIIAARMVRARLVSREPFAQQIKELFAIWQKPYTSTSDFLFEINLVNVTNNQTTVDRIAAEAEVDGKWVSLKLGDLGNYQIAFDEEHREGSFISEQSTVEDLPSLWDQIRGVPLLRGVAKQGWIDFEIDMPSAQHDKPLQNKVWIVDALGGTHPVIVLPSNPLNEGGRIKHSKKVYDRVR